MRAAAAFCDCTPTDVAVDQRDKPNITSRGGEPLKEAGESGDFEDVYMNRAWPSPGRLCFPLCSYSKAVDPR